MRIKTPIAIFCVALLIMQLCPSSLAAQERSIVRGGVVIPTEPSDSLTMEGAAVDSLTQEGGDTTTLNTKRRAVKNAMAVGQARDAKKKERTPFISDSMSLSRVCWTAAVLPGFGQIYNKEYWKLPILYGTLAGGIALFVNENKRYKPLKQEFESMVIENKLRTEEMDRVQSEMIRSNTRRQLYLGATMASYIYFLGDAAVRYATNDVSSVKKATTLATICPGAGQIYNKSYWKVPFVIGGFASLIYTVDWNNRGYKRFQSAYTLRKDYDNNPDAYPDGSMDEFDGRYTADYLKSLRDSYRRNRDLCIILTAGMYVLQIIDAHVDAHLKDYDISDDLSMTIAPNVDYAYIPSAGRESAVFGFNINLTF